MGRQRKLVLPPINLDSASPVAIYRQLAAQLATAIRRGELSGAQLPSTRTLSQLLGVSRNTVLAAYDDLVADGLIETRAGSGTRVPGPGNVFAPPRMLRDAQYPVRTLHIRDMDGGSLYLSY
jgi:GntR family transcriptional regulator / MocR family aminotransferase